MSNLKSLLLYGIPAAGAALLVATAYLWFTQLPRQTAKPYDLPSPQDAADRCAIIRASVEDAGFGDKVKVTCDEGHAHLASDTYPDHELMTGIVGTNEQIPVPAKGLCLANPVRANVRCCSANP